MTAQAFWCPGKPRNFDKPDRFAALPVQQCDRSQNHVGHSYVSYPTPTPEPVQTPSGDAA